ncbi:MAG: hypothetical protein DMG23_00730 [Acidobacteria bacterium]|nr:MAG: hypothetical protein DMG23_00730 [Acidobacteriota bacterium]
MRCPDCDEFDRRRFLKTVAMGSVGLATTAAVPIIQGTPARVPSKPDLSQRSETLVATLHQSLTAEQRQKVAFPFGHPLQSQVDNNWHITPIKIGEFFTPDQQAMITEIFRNLHNPEFADKVFYHINEDAGGLGNYSIALFGEPGTGAFEFVLTGRHCTARCDGDSVEGVAFGGPIFYGHASQGFNEKADHPKNVYWYQAQRANEVFKALDGKQRKIALLGDPRQEQGTATVDLSKPNERPVGLPVSEMTRDQRQLVEEVLHDLLLPFREKDRQKAMADIKAQGGFDALSMSFFKNMDIGNDGVWDVWQLESPTMVWYFRGSPHVHVWVNIRARA